MPSASAFSSLYHKRIVPPAVATVGSLPLSTVLSLNVVLVSGCNASVYGYAACVCGLPRKHCGTTIALSVAVHVSLSAIVLPCAIAVFVVTCVMCTGVLVNTCELLPAIVTGDGVMVPC